MRSTDATPLTGDSMVIATVDDALERDGQMLVLAGTHVLLLSALGAAVVTAAATPISLDALAARLVELFGTPPDGDAMTVTLDTVAQLLERAVLERVDASAGLRADSPLA